VVSFTPWPLYPRGKSPRCPLDRTLGGPQNRSGRRGEEESFNIVRDKIACFICSKALSFTKECKPHRHYETLNKDKFAVFLNVICEKIN
jgi:hypothetical protein